MTKKTDSLIFRFGIKTLWKNTDFLFRTSVSSSFFFKFLQFELQKFNFELLTLEQKKCNLLSLFLFCSFFNFFYNTLDKKKQVTLFFKTLLFYKCWFLFRVLSCFFYILKARKLDILLFSSLSFLTGLNFFSVCKHECSYPVNLKSLYALFFKVEQVRLETSLSFFFGRQFYIKLQNVFSLPLYFDFIQLPTFTNLTEESHLSTIGFMLYLSCKLRMASIFARYLAKNLELEAKHRKVLWSAVNAISLLSKNLCLFKGIRIYVTGKLNGKMRRKKYGFKFGKLTIQQINSSLDYFKATSFTKFGTISVKIWIFF